MPKKVERIIILVLLLLLIVIGLTACGRNIQNCEFNPGVTVEQKKAPEEGEVQKETELASKLPVKVSPKGEFNCSF